MNKTVLLTGATGFLGSHLAEKLLEKNYKVLAYHRLQSNFWRVQKFKDQIEWFNLNESLELPFQQHPKIHYIIHAITNYGRNNEPNCLCKFTAYSKYKYYDGRSRRNMGNFTRSSSIAKRN